jgi:hypothetical protein
MLFGFAPVMVVGWKAEASPFPGGERRYLAVWLLRQIYIAFCRFSPLILHFLPKPISWSTMILPIGLVGNVF